MRRSTVLEALLRLCGSKAIGSGGSPQLRMPPRLITAEAAVAGTAARATVGAAAGGAAGTQAAAKSPIAPPATPNRKWRRLEGCMQISPFIGPLYSAQARIQRIGQSVPSKLESEDREHDGGAREDR